MGSPFILINPQNTIIEPTPKLIITCPMGNAWLAILISKSAKVKQPIAVIIKIMPFRFVLAGILMVLLSMVGPVNLSFDLDTKLKGFSAFLIQYFFEYLSLIQYFFQHHFTLGTDNPFVFFNFIPYYF